MNYSSTPHPLPRSHCKLHDYTHICAWDKRQETVCATLKLVVLMEWIHTCTLLSSQCLKEQHLDSLTIRTQQHTSVKRVACFPPRLDSKRETWTSSTEENVHVSFIQCSLKMIFLEFSIKRKRSSETCPCLLWVHCLIFSAAEITRSSQPYDMIGWQILKVNSQSLPKDTKIQAVHCDYNIMYISIYVYMYEGG